VQDFSGGGAGGDLLLIAVLIAGFYDNAFNHLKKSKIIRKNQK